VSYLNLNLEKEFLGKKIIVTGASKGLVPIDAGEGKTYQT
jgi:hypothetical protein